MSETEKDYLLKMAKADYQYCEDQKTTRCYCTLKSVPSTSSDIRFQSHIIQVKKAKAKHEAEKNTCDTKQSYEAFQEDSSATDEDESLSCNEFTPVSVTTPRNRMPLSTLAMACERFHMSDTIGAAVVSAVLVDYGLITFNQRQNVIDKN